MDTCIQTHRCPGSLAAHVSVRYICRDYDKRKMWVLRVPTFDYESWIRYLDVSGPNDIKYCPYCGVELHGEEIGLQEDGRDRE